MALTDLNRLPWPFSSTWHWAQGCSPFEGKAVSARNWAGAWAPKGWQKWDGQSQCLCQSLKDEVLFLGSGPDLDTAPKSQSHGSRGRTS